MYQTKKVSVMAYRECPGCGFFYVSDEEDTCPECGWPVPRKCPFCGSEYESRDVICPGCGRQIDTLTHQVLPESDEEADDFDTGYDRGFDIGFDKGYDYGHDRGFEKGFEAGRNNDLAALETVQKQRQDRKTGQTMQQTDTVVTEDTEDAPTEEPSAMDPTSAQETPMPWISKVIGVLLVLLCLAVVIAIIGLQPVVIIFVLLVLYALLR